MVSADLLDAELRGDPDPVATSRVFNYRADKPFSCLYCKLSSSRKDVITRHTRNFHPDKMRTPSNDNSRSRSSLSPRRAASIQEQSDIDGTAGDREPRRMKTIGTNLWQDSDVTSAVYESFGDSISRENRLLGLDAPTATSADMLDIWGDFQFADPAILQLIGSDVLLLLDVTPQHDQGIRFPPLQAPPSPISNTSIASCPPESRGAFYIEGEKYERAKQKYDAVTTSEQFSSYRFPSKFAISRFVRGFFEYMAPHMPIVHLPTFNIISTPAPLLIEIMACGALYAKEPTAAQSLAARLSKNNMVSARPRKHTTSFRYIYSIVINDKLMSCPVTLPMPAPWFPLASLPATLFTAPIPETVDHVQIAKDCIDRLAADDVSVLAPDTAHWRDLLAMTSTLRTLTSGIPAGAAWRDITALHKPSGFKLKKKSEVVVIKGPLSYIDAQFHFINGLQPRGRCLRLVKIAPEVSLREETDGDYKIWSLSTMRKSSLKPPESAPYYLGAS